MTIREVGPDALGAYARVSIAFEVRERLKPASMEVEPVAPYRKDYDSLPDHEPASWPRRFDMAGWTFFLAEKDGVPIGAAALVLHGSETDLAELWDLRVDPEHRGRGIGKALFQRCVERVSAEGLGCLHVETQDVNVPACRFYAAMGCTLASVTPNAYAAFPEVADECMLVWRLDL